MVVKSGPCASDDLSRFSQAVEFPNSSLWASISCGRGSRGCGDVGGAVCFYISITQASAEFSRRSVCEGPVRTLTVVLAPPVCQSPPADCRSQKQPLGRQTRSSCSLTTGIAKAAYLWSLPPFGASVSRWLLIIGILTAVSLTAIRWRPPAPSNLPLCDLTLVEPTSLCAASSERA